MIRSHRPDRMILFSINACIEVDRSDRSVLNQSGQDIISGTGGQLDFVEGAYKSKGGQSFICLPSTIDIKGKVGSRYQTGFDPGGHRDFPQNRHPHAGHRIRDRQHERQEHLGKSRGADQYRSSRFQRYAGRRRRKHEHLAQIKQDRGSRSGYQLLEHRLHLYG